MSYLLDTNIVTAILKSNPKVIDKLRDISVQEQDIFISCITYFEVEGGLLAANATKKLSKFERLCSSDVTVLLLDRLEIIKISSRIYADLRRKGTPIQTADILIAATAIAHNLTLVSNDSDMLRVQKLIVENWLRSDVK
ncbi:MAG: type II toxin-antitoxin system VapC family toxin [Xenococcaceae cyanobacterium]